MKLSETKKNITDIINDYSQEFDVATQFVASMCYGAKNKIITFEKALNNFRKLYKNFQKI